MDSRLKSLYCDTNFTLLLYKWRIVKDTHLGFKDFDKCTEKSFASTNNPKSNTSKTQRFNQKFNKNKNIILTKEIDDNCIDSDQDVNLDVVDYNSD